MFLGNSSHLIVRISIFFMVFFMLIFSQSLSARCTDKDTKEKIVDCLEEKIGQLNARLEILSNPENSIPKGAVVPFSLTKCPTGWSEYVAAYGRFVRGIDRGSPKTDPEGERNIGRLQEDDYKEHSHKTYNTAGGQWPGGNDGKGSHLGGLNAERDSGLSGGKETRPKNVSLLFCIRD